MYPFLTGSRAYGTPRDDSDVDLVVVVNDSLTFEVLDACADGGGASGGVGSLRFGKLNLILLNQTEAEAWKEATDELITRKPVTREEAVKAIKAKIAEKTKPEIVKELEAA